MTEIMITAVDKHKVEFTSALGCGAATWVGMPPRQGNTYYVEIDIDEVLKFGENLIPSDKNISSVNVIDGKAVFVAEVISYEDDGILTISLGGNVVFLEIKLPAVITGFIKLFISPDKVFLYPVEL